MSVRPLIQDRAIIGMYYNRLEQGDLGWVNDLAFEIESSQDTETLKWLGMPPGMREWIGGRHAKSFLDFNYSLANKDWESTIEYHERDLAEDKTGQLQVRINEHADRALSHEAKLLSALIADGESKICYDGQYYFDTDHAEGDSGTQSNDLTYDAATPAKPTVAEMEDAILSSIEAMYGFKDDQGEPLNEGAASFGVMVPINMWKTARAAVAADTIVQGGTARDNLIRRFDDVKINIIVNPRLSWNTKFVTFRNDGSVKPFVKLMREPLTVDVLGAGSEYFFETRHVKVGLKKAGNIGFGMWQGAALTTFV